MIEIEGEYTTASVYGDEEMFDEAFFNQVQDIVNHEGFRDNISIMPDGHAGAGAVIGFTMPLKNRITPNVVGSDIGCGVTAVNIGTHSTGEMWTPSEIDEKIRSAVPMGLGATNSDPDYHIVNDFPWDECQSILDNYDLDINNDYGKEYFMDLCNRVGLDVNKVIASMGSLGSGNHFFEFSKSKQTGDNWLVVHSGSRCVGGAVASYWQEKASEKKLATSVLKSIDDWMWEYIKFEPDEHYSDVLDWIQGGKGESFYKMNKIREDFDGEEIEEKRQEFVSLIPDSNRNKELDYLEGEALEQYIIDMIFAQQYARENRKEMLRSACESIDVEMGEIIDSIHNYIDFRDGIIRKGATRAGVGERLVIPFNMAEGTIICRGKGNVEYNNSAPHGAGRRGSRRWAYREFDVDQFEEEMKGVSSFNDKEEVLDEIPSAYKSSDDILRWIEPTATVEEELIPIVNMKGE